MDEQRGLTRRQLLRRLGAAGGGTVVYQAMAGLGMTTSLEAAPVSIRQGIGQDRHVAILGAGIGGLTTAYELLRGRSGYRCTIFEANPKEGGRSLTLRHGDVLTERLPPGQSYVDAAGQSSSSQRVVFEPGTATGWDRPYLNAGPARIPAAHTHVLDYCRELKVPLEIYVMESRSNLERPGAQTYVNRRVANDARGWIAERLFSYIPQMTDLTADQKSAFQWLLVAFGALGNGDTGELGKFVKDGKYALSTRSGYKKLPGVQPGESVDPIPLPDLLATGFWMPAFYLPDDFPWQTTLFQPVGGMDRIVDALVKAIQRYPERAKIERNAPVIRIGYDAATRKWQIYRGGNPRPVTADVCISTIPIPLLAPLLDAGIPFSPPFIGALGTVGANKDFLAPTCKVGWQATRDLWQRPSAERTVPIFGGISWTGGDITQLWYPSDRFHDELGVVVGAYNYAPTATTWGQHVPAWRLQQARDGARQLAGSAFADGLGRGVTIAWQNMPFQRGGWAQWENVQNGVAHYNALLGGDKSVGFYICGDQMSQLPGWQEGAVVSALHAVSSIAVDNYKAPAVPSVPNSKIMVEGLIPLRRNEGPRSAASGPTPAGA